MGELTGLKGLKRMVLVYEEKANSSNGSPVVHFECEFCQDLQWIGSPARPCECQQINRRKRMTNALYRELGEIYRPHTLDNLKPNAKRHWKQIAIIKHLRLHPNDSWAFFGEKGIGKTLFASVLARHAIEQGRFVVAITLLRLLDQLRAWEFDDNAKPAIIADTLRDAKTEWCIVLDDLSVMSPTPFAGKELYDIVNTIYSTGRHQLIVTCHSEPSSLLARLEKSGDGYGMSILRRILDDERIIRPTELFELEKASRRND